MQLFTRWSRLFICWCILQWLSTNTTQPPRSVVKTHFHVKTVIKLKMGLSKIARLNVQTNNYSVIQHLWYRMYKTINHPQLLLESIKEKCNGYSVASWVDSSSVQHSYRNKLKNMKTTPSIVDGWKSGFRIANSNQ